MGHYMDNISCDDLEHEIILHLLRDDTAHVREIARNLEAPHSTVSRKLHGLVKKNIVDCEKRGKNKVYFLKSNLSSRICMYNAERFKFLKLIKTYPEMKIILKDVLESTDKDLVVLFGSYADFRADKDSDIDIYVEGTDQDIKEELENIHSKVNAKIGKFDPGESLIDEIIKKHIILRGVQRFYQHLNGFT